MIKKELEIRLNRIPSKQEINWCFWDYLKFKFKYNGSLDVDYFGTQMYLKSDFIRKDSFATFRRFPWRDKINDKKYINVFQDKRLFYKEFNEYLHREYKIFDTNTTFAEFFEFIKDKDSVFVKNPLSNGGKGVKLYTTDTKEKKNQLYNTLIQTPCVIETPILQCEELHCFSKYCAVNTLRIITIIDKEGIPHVVRCVFRMGANNSNLDNFSSGGMGAPVDIDTGIIFHPASNKLGKEYLIHPDSKKQIVGFVIPDWEEYKNFALKLALKFPTMRYIGWDIVKDKQGNYLVIEGNKDAGADVMECSLLYGLFPIYNKFLNMGNPLATVESNPST